MTRTIPIFWVNASRRHRESARVLADLRYDDPRRDAYGPALFGEVDEQQYAVYLLTGVVSDDSLWIYKDAGAAVIRTTVRANGFAATSWSDDDYAEMASHPAAADPFDGAPAGSLNTRRRYELTRRVTVTPTSADPFASLPRGTRRVPEERTAAWRPEDGPLFEGPRLDSLARWTLERSIAAPPLAVAEARAAVERMLRRLSDARFAELVLAAPMKAECIGCPAPAMCDEMCGLYRRATGAALRAAEERWLQQAGDWLLRAQAALLEEEKGRMAELTGEAVAVAPAELVALDAGGPCPACGAERWSGRPELMPEGTLLSLPVCENCEPLWDLHLKVLERAASFAALLEGEKERMAELMTEQETLEAAQVEEEKGEEPHDLATSLAARLEQNGSEAWEEEASAWLDLYEPSAEWADEARRLLAEWVPTGPRVSSPADFPTAPLTADTVNSKERASAAGTIGEPEAPVPPHDSDPGRCPVCRAIAERATGTGPREGLVFFRCFCGEEWWDFAEEPYNGDPPGRQEESNGVHHPAADHAGEVAAPQAGRDAEAQGDGEAEAVGDAPRQSTYQSVPAEQREETVKEAGLKVRVQMTSYFAGSYLSGNTDNYMVPEATGAEVLAALAPLKEACEARFPRKKGSKRTRIQITEQSAKGSAYMKREKGAVVALNLGLLGVTAEEASPLVDYLLSTRFGVRRREPGALAAVWRRFTEGGSPKPGTPPAQEAPLPVDSGRAENGSNTVQPEPLTEREEGLREVFKAALAYKAPSPDSISAPDHKTENGSNTVQPSDSGELPDPSRAQVLALCGELRKAGHGGLADRLVNAGGMPKRRMFAEGMAALSKDRG